MKKYRRIFFWIIPDLLIKSYIKSTSEIKISNYITTLTKDNLKYKKNFKTMAIIFKDYK